MDKNDNSKTPKPVYYRRQVVEERRPSLQTSLISHQQICTKCDFLYYIVKRIHVFSRLINVYYKLLNGKCINFNIKDNGSARSDDQTANNVLFQDTSSKSHDETVSESAKREKNRLLTIQELIQTESDYLIELSLCYDVFMTTNDEQHSVRFF